MLKKPEEYGFIGIIIPFLEKLDFLWNKYGIGFENDFFEEKMFEQVLDKIWSDNLEQFVTHINLRLEEPEIENDGKFFPQEKEELVVHLPMALSVLISVVGSAASSLGVEGPAILIVVITSVTLGIVLGPVSRIVNDRQNGPLFCRS